MKHSLTSGAGYVIVDHRDSPGVTAADVAHVPGAIPVGKGQVFEADGLTCSHCQRGILINPQRTRPRGYCGKCDHYVCDGCEAIRVQTNTCVPMVQRFDALQEQATKFLGQPDHPDAHPRVLLTDLV